MKTKWIVVKPLGIFNAGTVITEAVEISFAEDDNSDLEATQCDRLNTEDSLTEIVSPVGFEPLVI